MMAELNPDCRTGKHGACSDTAWDDDLGLVECPCPCHEGER